MGNKTAKPQPVFTSELRDNLKVIMQQEINNLQKTLKDLEPKERINVICKLIPYVFPKIQTVHSTDGEPWK